MLFARVVTHYVRVQILVKVNTALMVFAHSEVSLDEDDTIANMI